MTGALSSYLRRIWRASLTPGSLLTLEEACEALPGRPAEAAAWLADHVTPVGNVGDESVYRWADVLAAVERGVAQETARWLSTDEAAARLGVARSTLDEVVARAPRDLPGAPVTVGAGRRRRHLRWDAERLDEWFAAARANPPVTSPPRARAHVRRNEPGDGPVDWSTVIRDLGRS